MTETISNTTAPKKVRLGGLDLLRVFAMLLITLSHIVPSITSSYYSGINTEIMFLVDVTLRATGQWGNILFIVISFWFLLDSKRFKTSKLLALIINTVVCLWLGIAIAFIHDSFTGDKIAPWGFSDWKRIFFPISSEWYWFLAIYSIIYIVHPLLNKAIESMNQKTHFALALFLFLLVGVAHRFFFLWHMVLGFVMIYFVVGYFKKYPTRIHNSILWNLLIAISTILLLYPLVYLYHLWVDNGAYYNSPSEILVLWSSFIFVIFGISMLNVFRNIKINNKILSKLASASLTNYVLANNGYLVTIIIITFFDKMILPTFGTDYILLWWLLVNLGYFIVASIVTLIYAETIQKLVTKISVILGNLIEKLYDKFYQRFIAKKEQNLE